MLIDFKAYDLDFTVADNDIHDPFLEKWSQELLDQGICLPLHAYGYNGLRVLKHSALDESIIRFAFLNLESVCDGTPHKSMYAYYEPRRNPVRIYKISPLQVCLQQNPLPFWGIESMVWMTAVAPHYIDVEFSFRTHKAFQGKPLLFLVPNYIQSPEDLRIYFRAHQEWRTSEQQGFTYPCSENQRNKLLHCEQMVLAPLHKDIHLDIPMFYGRWRQMVLAYFFDSGENVSFAVNPAGAGAGSPAWDFQFYLGDIAEYKKYNFRARLVFKPYKSEEDILDEYRKWREGLSPLDFRGKPLL